MNRFFSFSSIVLCGLLSSCTLAGLCPNFDASKLSGSNPADFCLAQMRAENLTVGTVCLAHPEDLKPTQASLGQVHADCKRIKLESKANEGNGQLRKYLMKKTVPAIMGPADSIYLIDHHHFSWGLLNAFLPYKTPSEHRILFVCITEDLSRYSNANFWAKMESDGNVWLYDNYGKPISVAQLPPSIKHLSDDPYRTLAQWARSQYGFVHCDEDVAKDFPQCLNGSGIVPSPPFLEFRYANLFRPVIRIDGIYDISNQQQVSLLWKNNGVAMKTALSAKGQDGWNARMPQYTVQITLDERGCEASAVIILSSNNSSASSASSANTSGKPAVIGK
eukprot:NODE_1699_length_1437_cov_41.849424_g1533_i0.p1 GENE.NODE_1699_length_1437_cov_41.849424_g1533_i0~~NODE_1699_length_1437_cov_41.849424_g1533_i0.p1  ORF type:complete len:351 (+),score=69.06 NODE_1699_length_1437_cov_41.849424_g1533_i0:54-1055(+)